MADGLMVDITHDLGAFRLAARLDVPSGGGITVLFGPSGAGKSTLLRCIAGLARPGTGTIRFDGRVWVGEGEFEPPQGREIGWVPQEGSLFPHLSVRGNIEYPLKGLTKEERDRRVARVVESLGLAEMTGRLPSQVSGGQRQRVSLARALVTGPRLVLLDEPLSALDVPSRDQVRGELRRLLSALAAPAIVVTHDRADVLALADRVAVLIAGSVRQVGPAMEVFARPSDAEVAAIVGMETVVEGVIAGSEAGLARVRIGGAELLAVTEQSAGAVLVCIRGEDVVLRRAGAARDSARNTLAARVVWLRPEGALVRVGLDCGFALTALVTRPSVEELSIAVGSGLLAAIKAPAIHLIPR